MNNMYNIWMQDLLLDIDFLWLKNFHHVDYSVVHAKFLYQNGVRGLESRSNVYSYNYSWLLLYILLIQAGAVEQLEQKILDVSLNPVYFYSPLKLHVYIPVQVDLF